MVNLDSVNLQRSCYGKGNCNPTWLEFIYSALLIFVMYNCQKQHPHGKRLTQIINIKLTGPLPMMSIFEIQPGKLFLDLEFLSN